MNAIIGRRKGAWLPLRSGGYEPLPLATSPWQPARRHVVSRVRGNTHTTYNVTRMRRSPWTRETDKGFGDVHGTPLTHEGSPI